jgi:hypothetical protein
MVNDTTRLLCPDRAVVVKVEDATSEQEPVVRLATADEQARAPPAVSHERDGLWAGLH